MHGIFASGFIPILNQVLQTQATLAFAFYFGGILLGQLAIYKYFALSRHRNSYAYYEMAFGASLILMAIYNTPLGFIGGRLLEGLAAGLSTPLIFANLVVTEALGSVGTRIALFNSVFAIGYVLGPLSMALLMQWRPYQHSLLGFGALFILIPIALLFLPVQAGSTRDEGAGISLKALFTQGDWFEKFYTLFMAKSLYGYLLAFIAGYVTQILPGFSLTQVMLLFSLVFVVGQILTSQLLKVFPKEHLEVWLPLALSGLLLGLYFSHQPLLVFAIALCHSALALVGYLNFSLKASSAREFALFNSISDPAMVLGALLAGLGLNGVWGVLCFLPVPLIHFLRQAPQQTRAEKLYPFIGPLTIPRILRKHAAPQQALYQNRILEVAPALSLTPFHSDAAPRLKLLFGGDFCPAPPHLYSLSAELEALIADHDLRCLNLEGAQTIASYAEAGPSWQFDIPKQQFDAIVYPQQRQEPLFNLLSIANNHILDRGAEALDATLAQHAEGPALVGSELKILELAGLRLGFFGLTFGWNILWRQHPRLMRLKPETLLQSPRLQQHWRQRIQAMKAQVDLLVLSWHWGYESEFMPSDVQKQAFEFMREAGVDLLWGHHAHIAQGYELSPDQRALCLYCCGNFLSDMPGDVYQQGVLYSVELSQSDHGLRISAVTPHFFAPAGHCLSLLPTKQSEAWQVGSRIRKTLEAGQSPSSIHPL